jgi:hypothetical protein
MSRIEEFSRSRARTAREIVELFEADESARARVRPDWTPGFYFAELLGRKEYASATRFLAHALPKREAVWWACLSARQLPSKPESAAAIEAAEKWVANPTDANRRATMPLAVQAGMASAAGCAALAAFVSEGSLAPPDADPVPPGEQLMPETVAGGILLGAGECGETKVASQLGSFLELGLEVACGRKLWTEKR